MDSIDSISIADFDYVLPDEKIARYPLSNRDEAKLLVYKNNQISGHTFYQLPEFLENESLLVFNNAKVIPARLFFHKSSGAVIEIFCLEPVDVYKQSSPVQWKCFIGNNKRWKEELLSGTFDIHEKKITVNVQRKNQTEGAWIVEFSWDDSSLSFFDLLEQIGKIPLPPYLKRETEETDRKSYQTIYAKEKGSVAAPTAGLHFTDRVFSGLEQKDIQTDFVTLHVGAGTFKPVATEKITDHYMHTEKVMIRKDTIIRLFEHLDKPVVPVGTTSVRVLESLYWFGVKLLIDKENSSEMFISQWDPYLEKYNRSISVKDALQAVLTQLQTENKDFLYGGTQLMIIPGYRFRIVTGLVTNFHQPKSTLLLLIAALVGERWREIYAYALANNFRFLSYGDCCLFLK